MINFVNNGTDEAILKSLPIDGASDDLVKAMSKQGLIQKEVQVKGKNGKVFTRKQWVKAGDTKTVQQKSSSTNLGKDMTSSDFISAVKSKGFVDLGGGVSYRCIKATSDNIKMSDRLKSQLKSEGKYGSYISFCTTETSAPFSQDNLPVYGNSNAYVTKWFGFNQEDMIKKDLRSKSMELLKRANNAKIANKNSVQNTTKSPSAQPTQKEIGNSGQKLSKEDAKRKTQLYTSKVGKTEPERKLFMDKVKSQGIIWVESDNAGINWMRCCMAMNNHFASGGSFDDSDHNRSNKKITDNKSKVRSFKKFSSTEEKSIGEVSYDCGFSKTPQGIMEMLGVLNDDDINTPDEVIWKRYDEAIDKIKDNYKDCKDWQDAVDKYVWEESGNKYYKGKLDPNDGIWNMKKADKAVRQAIKADFDAQYARGIKFDETKVKSLGAGLYRVKVDTQTYFAYSGDKRKGVVVDIQFTDNGNVDYSEVVDY